MGGIISRGPGLSFVEGTAISPESRTSPQDTGIYTDAQVAAFKEITAFAHSQNQKIGIQLVHGGRKSSMVPLWLSFGATATAAAGGWPDEVYGASAIQHSEGFPQPKALTAEGVKRVVQDFVDAAKRSVEAGFDVIELHGAHGFLLHSFFSPVSNARTDEYGGSFENRTRIAVEIADGIRTVIPKDMPLFIRYAGPLRLL